MEKSKIRVIYEYEFRRGTTVSETARNINAVFGEGSTTKATVGNWFKNFRDGDFSLANEPRGRPKTKVDNDHLRAVVESDPSQSTRELASIFNVSIPTILVHLAAIGKIKKLDKWVPHELTDAQQAQRLEASLSLLSRHKNESFFNRIVTCDEKWILYDNRKRSHQWLNADEPPRHHAKPNVTQKKLMVTVWWSRSGVFYYNFMKPGTSITAEVYRKQLDEMMQQLAIKQPKLVNRSMPILLHDNARPHAARLTVAKLRELELETLRHPPYSPDLSPTDYHFFRNLDNLLVGKFFNSQQAVETALRDFIDSRTPGFYSRGIDQLPLKWQKCVDNMGAYFD
ncbi:histone-lysine N-methyltransferase SETMAR-like [Ooceraea biroi]|uniref:histone-lysine N-methyltransferase SETMAR-like n=2 Tax=Ooceraea biroi TaxID=2015173 RepID=UPI000F07CD32|nr:histone-lysine N-methyltransferase SETMAR-like [Ooceraea biroi]